FLGTKKDGKHNGGFKQFTGTVELAENGKGINKISADIDTASMWTDTEPKLTDHLKGPEFFYVQKFPKATFVSTKIDSGNENPWATHTITGDFTLHGVKKSLSFPARISISEKGLTLITHFNINRFDYNISYGKGQVNDTVEINVNLGA